MDWILVNQLLLAILFGLFDVGGGKPEKIACLMDSDCAGQKDVRMHECTVKECKCRFGFHGTDKNNCKSPNWCNVNGDCKASGTICFKESHCRCEKGFAKFDKDGKIKECVEFPSCSEDSDCDPDSLCEEGNCRCRMGTLVAQNAMKEYCITFNRCGSDKECPFIDGYCNMESETCTCKEGMAKKNSLGRVYKCGPNWIKILIPVILVLLFVIIVTVVVIALYIKRKRDLKRAAEE